MLSRFKFSLKIYHIYFVLVALDFALLSISLLFNNMNITRYSESIQSGQIYVKNFEFAEKLASLVADADAPGNDIFESHDVERERQRLRASKKEYDKFIAEIGPSITDPHAKNRLSKIDEALREMVISAENIFDWFERHDEKKAASLMAAMDQKFAEINQNLAGLRAHFNKHHEEVLHLHEDQMKAAYNYETILGVVFILMISLVTVFGFVFVNRIQNQEKTMQESAKMVALGEMAGGIAHEINNPLAIIRTKASQLRRLIASDRMDSVQAVSFLKDIEDTSIKMGKIVDGLRTFSRSSEGEQMSPILVSKLIADTHGLCQERLAKHGLKLEIDFPQDCEIHCRPVQIEQVLVNLVNNSFDAISGTPDPWIRISVQKKEQDLEISVTDSGNGIPEDIAKKITQPFFTTKPVGKGTGLGLSISVGIAKSHGGALSLNRECKNTQFILRLPFANENQGIKKVGA